MEPSPNKPQQRQAHVLILPCPIQGHINPMLQFAKRLISKGVKATLATTVFRSRFMHVDPSARIDVVTFSDGCDEDTEATRDESTEAYQTSLRVVGSRSLADLIRKLDGSSQPIDAVIYDGFLSWVLDVAKQCGKIGAVFFTQTCAVNNIYYHVQRGLVKLPLSADGRVEIPSLPSLEPSETPSLVYDLGSYPAFFGTVVNDQFSRKVDEADFWFVNTFYELEKKEIDWMSSNLWPLKTIGPTIPSRYLDKRLPDDNAYGVNIFKPTTDAVAHWLDQHPHRSVVYVSFGSLATLQPPQVAELAHGLILAGHPFLWILRKAEKHKLPPNLLDSFPPERALVLPWCNQLEVLSHDSVGCFLTHCGLSSVLETICLGVPMVAMPQWTDQPTNAKYVEDVWKVGVRVRVGDGGLVRREEVERRVREVIDGGERGREINENAKKWKELAEMALSDGGSSDRNIDEFVKKLTCLS